MMIRREILAAMMLAILLLPAGCARNPAQSPETSDQEGGFAFRMPGTVESENVEQAIPGSSAMKMHLYHSTFEGIDLDVNWGDFPKEVELRQEDQRAMGRGVMGMLHKSGGSIRQELHDRRQLSDGTKLDGTRFRAETNQLKIQGLMFVRNGGGASDQPARLWQVLVKTPRASDDSVADAFLASFRFLNQSPKPPGAITPNFRPPIHPPWRRCSSVTY